MERTHYLHLDCNAPATEPVLPSRHILELAAFKTLPKSSNIYTPQRLELQENKNTITTESLVLGLFVFYTYSH